ncbi:hypothetical protein NC652_009648 [Populus alba x Populus x berolinensis]|nr:hypothetical protein NC652_009648 [Populus alba x Populus x berolinensis]
MQVVKLVSHFSFLLLMLMFQPALAQAPAGLAKPNCPDHCGNITIPYPFGIGKDCYMEESFDVECDETSDPPRAFLRSIKMDLVNITLERGAVVKGPVISVDSLRRQEVLPLNLEGTPFFVYNNYFIAVGCNTRASLWTKTGTTEHVGCDSICSNGTSISNIRHNGTCFGKDCCQDMYFPISLQVFNSTFELIEGKQGSVGRKLAFLADSNWFYYDKIWSPQDINKLPSTVPMSLTWILNSNSWTYNEDNMHCNFFQLNSTTNMTSGRCSCSEGYEGNPYLQCRVIGLALGVLFLLIGAWWMSKLIKRRKCIQLKKKFFKRNGEYRESKNRGGCGAEQSRTWSSRINIDTARAWTNQQQQQQQRKCLNLNGKNRPTMKEVSTELERVIKKGSNVQQDSQENENIMADLSMQYMGCISDINNDL